ncbi:MAG: hypothetical protein J6X55_10020 [Victivallales bacterium]|nr:hypothetical protein [Victivallales bacterium]
MNLKKLFGGLLAAAVFAGMTVMAQEAEKSEWMPEFDFNMKYASRYLSKGKVVNPKKMLFFDASLSLQGFYGGIWIADDWNDYYRESGIVGEPEEIDYYFGYGYTFEELPVIDSLSLDLCVSYYDYPKRTGWQCKGEQQWEYALSLNAGVFLNPGIKLCWDSENEIWYGNFNAGWDYNFKDEGIEALTFNTGLELWWGNSKFFYNGGRDITFTTLCWNMQLDYAITDNITISPFATLAWALNHNYREAWKDGWFMDEDGDLWRYANPNAKKGMNTLYGIKIDFCF